SPFPDVQIDRQVTFPDYIRSKLEKFASKVAIIDSTNGKQHTYAEVLNLAEKFKRSIAHLTDVHKTDVVSLCLSNCVEILPLAMAITSFGAVFNTSNPNYTVDELVYQYKLVKSKYLVTNSKNVEKIKKVKEQCPTVRQIIVIDGTPEGCLNLYELDDQKRTKNEPVPEKAVPEDVAFLFSSSGTTGLPKQIMLTHGNLVANLSQLSPNSAKNMKMFCPTENDTILSVFPYFHLAGLLNGLVWVLKEGGRSIILPKYEPNIFLKPNILIAPPPIHVFLTKSALAEKADLSSIRTVVNRAAPIAPSVVEALCKRLNMEYVVNGYGMTELSTIGLIIPICDLSRNKYGSCGVPLPNTLCKVVDPETNETVGPNKRGQLMIKGLNVCKGYLYNVEATKEAINDEGWLQTGDIGYYDEDGFFYIVDRIKEMIKVKAFQVAPAEIEQCLLKNDAVADVAVVGILDEYAGELPFAFVVKKSPLDHDVTEKEIQDFVAERLTKYKHLTGGVRFVDAIPKNPSGKILRRLLRDQIRKEFASKQA
uniref:Uncharacterized protein n=1 Tax=Romanomermis culicivorax TaxID=13658 RepID=A0A915J912_ROMCU